ncbi:MULTISPECIES: isochorismate synthase MenF [unclassified Saccharopolyspora]|uniref:isochorismate synthase n=1 Tax=unclassified Saccharopolyspora TaxID=2646250 RepID=UPI001CD4FAAA|nr:MULTISPECIES: chorismate-binding protein [unclassified Saccharopolyspora]MCA1191043.1 chorismate-binding protein [Saccharopolyspora sp. 6V]MCA1278695.1 chorismate-binding protein [Saccharopolyspora sp. 7B]
MAPSPTPLTVRTSVLPDDDPRRTAPLLELLPDEAPLSWVRDGAGLVGWGCAARLTTSGPERFAAADEWWHALCAAADVRDEVRLPGSGPVAFTSFAFADRPGDSVVVVPEVVVGCRDGVRWITTVGDPARRPVRPVREPGAVRYEPGAVSAADYRRSVAEAVRILEPAGAGDPDGVRKVVLAHDLLATAAEPLDARYLLRNLAARYPGCWTFAVDGLVGATPELLLERTGRHVRSRVLAGTSWPRPGVGADELASGLLASVKDLSEHAFAAESLAAELRPFCAALSVPEHPEVLRLRNVLHLASHITGELHEHAADNGVAALLRLAAAVHPSAAVGGTPTPAAVRLIERLEAMDRGRYSGPVGWVDGAGNGELGIALRCAQLETADGATGGRRARLFAGCGIVAGSDPDAEVLEAAAKLRPIRDALADD